jgi:hypothetical protein
VPTFYKTNQFYRVRLIERLLYNNIQFNLIPNTDAINGWLDVIAEHLAMTLGASAFPNLCQITANHFELIRPFSFSQFDSTRAEQFPVGRTVGNIADFTLKKPNFFLLNFGIIIFLKQP